MMAIKIGDMIKIINPNDPHFGYEYTVVKIDESSDTIFYGCLRGSMYRRTYFEICDVEQIDSPPRFTSGTIVSPLYPFAHPFDGSNIGIVEVSNRLASMVRIWDEYDREHSIRYVSNRKIRMIK